MRKVKDFKQRKIKFIKKFGHSKIGKRNRWQIKKLENTVFRKLFLWQFSLGKISLVKSVFGINIFWQKWFGKSGRESYFSTLIKSSIVPLH